MKKPKKKDKKSAYYFMTQMTQKEFDEMVAKYGIKTYSPKRISQRVENPQSSFDRILEQIRNFKGK